MCACANTYVHTYIGICVILSTYIVCVCVCVYMYVRAYVCEVACSFVDTYVHTYVWVCNIAYTYVRMYVPTILCDGTHSSPIQCKIML